MKILRLFCLATILTMLSFSGMAQTNWYVSTSGNNTTGDGSAGNPWKTIKGAVDKAEVTNNDIINVAAGTYTEVNITITKTLNIIGAGAGQTIVQAQDTQPDGTAPVNNKRVFLLNSPANVTIKDLSIQNGNILGGGGGAVRINAGCTLIIENCNVMNCYTSSGGGAFSCNGNLTVLNCAIFNNTAASSGGAFNISGNNQVANVSVTNCMIYSNSTSAGNNTNTNGGGGAMFAKGSNTNDCLITLNNNTIVGNMSNHANNPNNGIRLENNAKITSLTNNIFFNSSNNTSDGVDLAASATLLPTENANLNNIYSFVWAAPMSSTTIPSAGSGAAFPTEAELKFGTFTQAVDGLWSLPLLQGSIAIDAADASTATTTDMHGTTRYNTPDIGAFEYSTPTNIDTETLEVSIYPSPSNGNFTVRLSNNEPASLEVYTLTGQKVFEETISNNLSNITLPSNIKGMVLIRISGNGHDVIQKHLITR